MAGSSDNELTVFNDARQLPPEQRAAFLETACSADSDLRRRVEELLHAEQESASFLETPAGELLDPGEFLRSKNVPAEKTGDKIDRYELLEPIGEGGCGTVYKARQEQPVRRNVALKIIKLGMDTKSVIARFEAERQALALMDHPSIAKVLDAGSTDTGRPYFVMELVDGIKITDFCDQNHLSTRQRLELFIQVCHAVQHAHQKGIIHRDIKPSNILVTMIDGVPVPKVIDFGIAKATGGKLTEETFFTAVEQFVGTPAYMSPEQADAREVDIDTRSDIYSLGVLLYELLTGRTPFDAKELLQSGIDQIRRIIREEEPAAPSTRLSTMEGVVLREVAVYRKTDAQQLIHLIQGDLDWIIMKSLEKDRARRYETTNALALDIQRHLKNEPVAARPPSRTYQFQKMVRRNRLVFAACTAVALALMVGVAVSIHASIKEHQARIEADNLRAQAQADQKKAETEAYKSGQVAQFLENMLSGVGPSVAMGADTTLLKKILDNTSKEIGTGLTNEPDVEGDIRDTLGQVYWEIGDLTNAEVMYRHALLLRQNIPGPESTKAAESMERLSHVLWREGKLDEAEKIAQAGNAIQMRIYGETNLEVARSLEAYAAILNTKGFGSKAVSLLRQALTVKETILGHDNLEVADTLDDLSGLLLSMHSSIPQAEALSREALDIRKDLLGTNNLIVVINSLRVEKTDEDIQGRSSDEEATLDQLVDAQRQLYGGPHPDLAQSLNTLASVLKNEDKLAESEPIRREALAMQQKLLGPESAEVAQTLAYLGQLLAQENKLAEAESLLRSCYEMRRKIFGDSVALTATSLLDLGKVLEAEGKADEAASLYMQHTGGMNASAISADFALGMLYLEGRGVKKDPQEGVQWITRSAMMGHTEARTELGVLYFNGTEVPKDEDLALRWFNVAAGIGTSTSLKSTPLKTLAKCYCAAGRIPEALATMQKVSSSNPSDTDSVLTLAAWQVWFRQESDYEATRTRLMQRAENVAETTKAQAAVKCYCLEPSTNSVLLTSALSLARFGVERRKGTPWLAWYQLELGMVQYRMGSYADAEQTFAMAEQTAGKFQEIVSTARFYRTMCLFQSGDEAKARELFAQTKERMTPLPSDPNKLVIGGDAASHDVVIEWLACREAGSLLSTEATR